jgi:hypothetical protein
MGAISLSNTAPTSSRSKTNHSVHNQEGEVKLTYQRQRDGGHGNYWFNLGPELGSDEAQK